MRPVLLLVLALLLSGCARPGTTPGASLEGGSLSQPGDLETPRPYVFETRIFDGAFEHPRLDAATQATLVWQNEGSETHSVVSDDGTFAGSGPIAPGSSFEATFQTPGDHPFHCRYHPEMKGLLVVR